MIENSTSATTYAQKCKDSKLTCDSWKWNSPEDATEKASCGEVHPEKIWPPEFENVEGAALDGDF